jgi:proliferating cell nuclear antigen
MSNTIDTISAETEDENVLLYIHTKKIPAIKSVFESLKEIFRDVNLKFIPKKEIISEDDPENKKVVGGMYITALNSNSNILVRLHLEADKFCYYKCEPDNGKPYVMLSVNMSNLFKIIKFLNNDDELHMIYNKLHRNQLNLKYINRPKKMISNYYLGLLDLDEETYKIGNQKFDFVITIQSNDFHTLIKNMSVIAETVDIQFSNTPNGYNLTFKCKGEFASQESEFIGTTNSSVDGNIMVEKNKDPNGEDVESDNETTIIQGVYELKSLSLFSRCSSLCPTIELFIKNDAPLIIKYRVADMGSVHLILTSINDSNGISEDEDSDSEKSEGENDD